MSKKQPSPKGGGVRWLHRFDPVSLCVRLLVDSLSVWTLSRDGFSEQAMIGWTGGIGATVRTDPGSLLFERRW